MSKAKKQEKAQAPSEPRVLTQFDLDGCFGWDLIPDADDETPSPYAKALANKEGK